MAIPFGSGNSPLSYYVVEFTLPGIDSIISKGEKTSLMIPNSKFLVEFIDGNIGISDSMQKDIMYKNLNSPIASADEMVFRSFAETNKIEVSDLNKKSNGKMVMPKDAIELSSENDLLGLKGLEVTTLKSIFETQKPYLEIAELVIGNLAKLEDVTARVMPLLGIPLKTKSKKPKGNPNAVGYESGKIVKAELAKIKAVKKKGGGVKVGPNGTIIKLDDDTTESSGTNNGNGNDGGDGTPGDGNWTIISTVYSTGRFDSNVDYTYKYIDLPADSGLGIEESDLDLDEERDPYLKHKPKSIIFGIFDSKGTPLNPLSKIKGIDNQGDEVDTNFTKAGWILDSPKWVFRPGVYQWPGFGTPNYERYGPDNLVRYYTEGQTNVLNGEKAIPGTPKILSFQSTEVNEYRDFFTDLIAIKMLDNEELTQEERIAVGQDISGRLNVPSHLENVFVWGQAKSSVYNKIGIPQKYLQDNGLVPSSKNDPYPNSVGRSFKPLKIYSESAKNDEKLRSYAESKGEEPGWIWIDPESDYVTKVIRIDPTTKITYKYAEGEPEIESEIKSFVKNVATFQISDNREFNVEVLRSIGDEYSVFDSAEGVTSYDLENWNYIDNDGLIGDTFGVINEKPELNNSNSFKMTLWGDTPTTYYNTGENLYINIQMDDENNIKVSKVEKSGDKWTITISEKDISGISIQGSLFVNASLTLEADESITNLINSDDLAELYNNYYNNPGYTETVFATVVDNDVSYQVPLIINSSEVFSNLSDVTPGNGKFRLIDGSLDTGSLVEIENNFITKWYYMTPNEDTIDYNNGDLNNGLPPNGTRRSFVIDVNSIGGDNLNPVDSNTDENIPQFQIRVKDDDSTSGIIDPSKVLNTPLTIADPFSLGKYGHGSSDNPQDIDVIKRFMLTELDTESYYIIEGVLPELVDDNGIYDGGASNNSSSSGGGGGEGGDYKLPDAIGAIKVLISVLGDIFGKLIPTIIKTIELFKNPASFVTSIISEQMKDGFIFASDDSIKAFMEGQQFKKDIQSDGDERIKKQKVQDLGDFFKSTTLSNFVFVRDDGEFGSVLDGIAGIPFGIFGASIPFGMEMDFSKIPGSPLNLVFPSKINLNKVKNLQSFLSPQKFDDTNASNLASQINEANKAPKKTEDLNLNTGGDKTDGKNDTKTKIEFADGSSIFIDDGSVDEYVIDNSSRYNFVYISENAKKQFDEVDALIETGTPENLKKALSILDDINEIPGNNKEVDLKKKSIKDKLDKIDGGEQPLLKFILGLVTLPIKILGGIIEYIMEFFKKLTNPLKLPSLIAEFLSFSWIMDFFTPPGLLDMIGITIKPEKIAEWGALAKLPTPPNVDLADLTEFLDLAFGVKLPTYTKEQYSAIKPDLPLNLMKGLFCFIEKIINGIIDFIWSTLGIECVIPPPHIKLCSGSDNMTPEEISKALNGLGVITDDKADLNGDGILSEDEKNATNANSNFYYEVELPNGEKKQFLDRVALDSFIEENKGLNYDFTF
jgi:hypothetical protein